MVPTQPPGGCWAIERPSEAGELVCRFFGPTPTTELPSFLDALTARMPEAPVTLVFDLTELNGYNPDAKEPIKAWLLQHKLAIRNVVVLVPRSGLMARMATAAIGLAVRVPITIREALPGPPPSASFSSA